MCFYTAGVDIGSSSSIAVILKNGKEIIATNAIVNKTFSEIIHKNF